jgi:general secretion pathway protein J
MTGAPEQSRCAGFTLVEALATTVLMTIILAALATITAQWLPSWDRGFARLQGGRVLAAGLERLTDDIAAAQYVSTGAAANVPPLFDGGELSVTFVRTTLAPNVATGLEVVRLAEAGGEQGPALVRSTAPLPIGSDFSPENGDLLFANPVVMIRAPYRVSFSYAGPDRVWQSTWHGQVALPRAVRVSLRDNATSMILGVSTSTLVHAELPARCAWASTVAECPMLNPNGVPPTNSSNGTGGTGE